MTIRQQQYKYNRCVLRMNQYNAAKAAGYSDAIARRACVKLEPKIDMADWLEQVGITDKIIAEKTKESLDATKVISCNIFIDKDGKMKEADGQSNDFIEVPDYPTRLNTLKFAAQIKGHIDKAPKDLPNNNVTLIQLIQKIGSNGNGNGHATIDITREPSERTAQFLAS
jgi:hypothetical protein